MSWQNRGGLHLPLNPYHRRKIKIEKNKCGGRYDIFDKNESKMEAIGQRCLKYNEINGEESVINGTCNIRLV